VTAVQPSMRATRPSEPIDEVAATQAVTDLLTAFGIDLSEEGVRDTPKRVVASLREMLTSRPFNLTTFPNDEGYDQLILARSIKFHSLCMHHLLPFVGVAHVGYLPGERILGLSKLARVVEMFSRGLQVQEQLTQQIANWLAENLEPKGVGVIMEAEHLCMSLRGIRQPGTTTVTSALLGRIRTDQRTRSEFLTLAGLHDRPGV